MIIKNRDLLSYIWKRNLCWTGSTFFLYLLESNSFKSPTSFFWSSWLPCEHCETKVRAFLLPCAYNQEVHYLLTTTKSYLSLRKCMKCLAGFTHKLLSKPSWCLNVALKSVYCFTLHSTTRAESQRCHLCHVFCCVDSVNTADLEMKFHYKVGDKDPTEVKKRKTWTRSFQVTLCEKIDSFPTKFKLTTETQINVKSLKCILFVINYASLPLK